MRLLLCLFCCVLCSGLFAQIHLRELSSETSPARRWRLGISYHTDNNRSNPYLDEGILILPRVRRANALLLLADYRISDSGSTYLKTELGYYQVTAGNDEARWLANNSWRGPNFSERVGMNYWHLGLGLRFEPFSPKRLSPLIGLQFQFALPNNVNYLYQDNSLAGPNSQIKVEIDGGTKATVGCKFDVGFRYQLKERLTASLAYYYAFMNFQANWPTIAQRQLSNAIMRLSSGGIEIGCQYSI